jgi:hypothetical protein
MIFGEAPTFRRLPEVLREIESQVSEDDIAAVIDRIGLSLTESGAGSSAPFAAPPRSRKCLTAIDNCQAEQPAARRLPATKKSQ